MRSAEIVILLIACLCLINSAQALVYCPSADITGDRFVDPQDLLLMANLWLTTDPCVPDDMAYIPYGGYEMGDHLLEGTSSELPLHPVLLDSFIIGKYEVSNRQYCDFLNAAQDGNEIRLKRVLSMPHQTTATVTLIVILQQNPLTVRLTTIT